MRDKGGDYKFETPVFPKKYRSLEMQTIASAKRHPNFIRPYLRLIFRRDIVTPFARRFRRAYVALPARIQIQPTRRCNLKCAMCIQHRHSSDTNQNLPWHDPDRELSLDEWTAFLDKISFFRPCINISGGEPMLYSHFGELLQATNQRNLLVEINTNGTLLAKYAYSLVHNGVFAVSVSIDGTEDTHDSIRGQKGLFRIITDGINALAKVRKDHNSPTPIIQIACTISKGNLTVLKDMVPLALELNADIMLFQHTDFNTCINIEKHNRILSPKSASAWGLNILQPSIPNGEYYESKIDSQDVLLIQKALGNAKRQSDGKLRVFVSPNIKLDNIGAYYLDVEYPSSQVCVGLWTNMRVLSDGTVSPCLHILAGNITEKPINEIWNGSVMRNLRRHVRKRLYPGCARCCYRRF